MANISIHYVIYNKERHQDGKYPIKLRFTYKRVPTVVATNLFAVDGELAAVKKGEENKSRIIKDSNLRRKVEDLIRKYEDASMMFDPFLFPEWTVSDVVKYLDKTIHKDNFHLDFPDFCDKFVENKRKTSTSKRAANNYLDAKKALIAYMGKEHFDISVLTSARLRDFEAFLINKYGKNARAVSLYAAGIAKIHKTAQETYNSEEMDQVLVKNPYAYYTVPKQATSKHRDVDLECVQQMINDYHSLTGRERVGVGAFLLSFATMGMNVPDLYEAVLLGNDKIHYFRHKTRERRKDSAEMVVKIPKCIKGLYKEYSDKEKPRKRVFNFHVRYSSYSNMNDAVEKGIRDYRDRVGYPSLTLYSARHTWATTARSSKCQISAPMIDECLAHVTHAPLVDVYAKKDFSIYWDVNEKVLSTLDWGPLER